MPLPRWLRWRSDRDLKEEIDAHLEIETREQIDRGLPADDARHAALRAFGNPGRIRELAREASPLYQLDLLGQDIGFAFRLLRRTPLLAGTIVATLVLGISLNATVFTILNAFLLRPLVSKDPATFVEVYPAFSGEYSRSIHGSPAMVTLDEYEAFREGVRSLSAVVASAPTSLTLGGDEPVNLRGMFVSCNYLAAHLDAPVLGRTFRPDDCARAGAEPVAVLNEKLWRRHFDADPSIVGRTILLNKQTFTVIGVAPNQLVLDVPPMSIWVPFSMRGALYPSEDYFRRGSNHAWLEVSGRLAAGATVAQAQAEFSTIAARLDLQHPGRQTRMLVNNGAHIHSPFFSRHAPIVFGLLMGSFTLILLIVCGNVTTLLLSRAAGRRQEMAVRLSLGAGRARLLRQLITESLLLALVAGAASWWLAYHLPRALMNLSADAPAEVSLSPDWRVFLFTLVAATLAGCIAGLSPALESLRVDLSASLKPTGRGGPSQARVRGWLVAGQLAASIALLVAAGLIVRSQGRLFTVNVGYDPASVVVMPVTLSASGYDAAAARTFYDRLEARLRGLPGVRATATSHSAPFRSTSSTAVRLSENAEQHRAAFRRVSPGYFEALQIPILGGRPFADAETGSTGGVTPIVVSRAFASRLWPDRNPIGQRLTVATDTQAQVVAVAADTSSMNLGEADGLMFYLPLAATLDGVVIVRAAGSAAPLAPAIRSAVRELDSQLATSPETIRESLDRLAERYAFMMKVAWIPAGLAFVLCVIGIYGMAAFAATQRTQEIGIRLAIGALPSDVVRLLIGALARPLAAGIIVGVVVAAVLGFLMEKARLLLDVEPIDPLSYGVVCAIVASAALAATFLPARRASRVDPVAALRAE
jgi:predicted permease